MVKKTKKSFGLLEVIIGTIILTIVAAGYYATFLGAKKYVTRAQARLKSANIIRSYLSRFINKIDAETWDDPSDIFYPSGNMDLTSELHASMITAGYSAGYRVIDHGNYREVVAAVQYPVE